jgi:hypothetical protein
VKLTPHGTDRVSLVFGLAFLGGAVLWLTARFVTLQPATVGWIAAGGLIVLGMLGIAVTITTKQRR